MTDCARPRPGSARGFLYWHGFWWAPAGSAGTCLAGRSWGGAASWLRLESGSVPGGERKRRNTSLFIGFSVALAAIVSPWVPHKRAETPSRCCLITCPHRVCEQQIPRRPLPGPGALGKCLARVSSFLTERGSQHRRGGPGCAEQLRWAGPGRHHGCQAVGEFMGPEAVGKGREEGQGGRWRGNRDLSQGYPRRGLNQLSHMVLEYVTSRA